MSLKNLYGGSLKPCTSGDFKGSSMEDGKCTENGGGVHQICMHVDETIQDFAKKTYQRRNWSSGRVGKNHCMCLGAYALYQVENGARRNPASFVQCDAIPETIFDGSNMKNWNVWNGYEHDNQIVEGIDSIVLSCMEQQTDETKRRFLNQKYDALRGSYSQTFGVQWESALI